MAENPAFKGEMPPPMAPGAQPYPGQPYPGQPMQPGSQYYPGPPMPVTAQPYPGPYQPNVQPGMPPPPPGAPVIAMAPLMAAPAIAGCPPGLEYLAMVDQLLVQQQIELLEMITGFETNNKYELKNSLGQRVYFAGEQTDCLMRNCCGPIRAFDIKVADNTGRTVMHIRRPLRCQNCCCFCCLQQLEVYAPEGHLIGTVEQDWSICIPKFTIYDSDHKEVLRLTGPCITCRCCSDVKFPITSLDGDHEVGCISKQWSGLAQEMFTDADNFSVTFPMDMDVKIKATLVACAFLIDFMFFEETNKNNNHHHH